MELGYLISILKALPEAKRRDLMSDWSQLEVDRFLNHAIVPERTERPDDGIPARYQEFLQYGCFSSAFLELLPTIEEGLINDV